MSEVTTTTETNLLDTITAPITNIAKGVNSTPAQSALGMAYAGFVGWSVGLARGHKAAREGRELTSVVGIPVFG